MKNNSNKVALALGILFALGGITLAVLLGNTPASAAPKVASHGLHLPDGTRLPAGAASVAFDRLSGPTTTPTPTHAPTPAPTPAAHGAPRITGTPKAGASVRVVPQAFKNVPRTSTEVVTWYVDAKAVGHARKLKLKSAWKGHKLAVQVERTWTTKTRKHGHTVIRHHAVGGRSKAVRVR